MVMNLLVISLCFIKKPILLHNNINKNYINTNLFPINNNEIYNRVNIIENSIKLIPCDYDNNEKCFAYCVDDENDEVCNVIVKESYYKKIKLFLYIVIWFVLSAKYNIANKQRLIMLNLPWFQSMASLGSGSLIALFFWKTKIRKPPKLTIESIKTYIPISFFHSIGHISAVVSVGAGAVSFTQIVKAAEPLFTCGFNWILLGDKITLPVGLSLIPIILGVSFASISELYFTWTSFIGAMVSNIAFAGRNVASRLALDKPKGENITPENLFGILTIMSFLMSVIFTIIFEGNKIQNIWIHKTYPTHLILKKTFETGMYFYLYNEAAMMVLNNMNPVSHAIINTLKRVILLLVCVLFFNTPLSRNGIIGSSIAIGGSYLYAKAKQKNK
tara:strand:- start:116 stop:1276 length:1161 start_codon:yes stop_codon:yes gene_type:complete